ncbi:MAG: hypothetical protein EOO42_01215 [Flavobacteriales bacterium]|nr:MAG: hypothetical protein EOO42_01215 [Flavobacteriales bacterium]
MAEVGITRIEDKYYLKNGVRSFSLRLRYPGETVSYIPLTGCRVELSLANSLSDETYKWSNSLAGENQLVLEAGGLTGKITFPEIKSWDMPLGIHRGDLNIYDAEGFLITYRTLEFEIVKND